MPSRAELVALAALSLLAATTLVAYVLARVGLGIAPTITIVLSAACAAACCAGLSHVTARAAAVSFAVPFVVATGYLWWIGWPSLLPGGSGPDLTHHLQLIDYLQERGTLVDDPNAWRELGEMAHYTPGVHVLAVITAILFDTDALFVIFPIVVLSVGLKYGLFGLVVWRLTGESRRDATMAAPMAIAGAGLLVHLSALTLHSFTRDSFLAQVVSELFAVGMMWSVVIWAEQPARRWMVVAGLSGAAVFLTWPLWIGPLLIALAAVVTTAPLTRGAKIQHIALATAPIVLVAVAHTGGRSEAIGIIGTSGAVDPPVLSVALSWVLLLAIVGYYLAAQRAQSRPLVWLTLGLAAQAAALWLLARRQGAATPYMAVKMAYLAVYPVTAAALIAIGVLVRSPWVAWALSLAIFVSGARGVVRAETPPAIVDRDLFAAGRWAREHLPRGCVDYLVGNEYTAYWLHLAVLRHPRVSERTANNDLYLPEPSFARWVEERSEAPYAIAKWSVLPMEIRDRVRVLHRQGDAVVIVSSRPAAADGTCVASLPATTS